MIYCKECGKPNEPLSNFCSKCGNPFVSLGKASPPVKIKPKFVPRQVEREEDDDEDDVDDEGVIESSIPQIEGLEYEIEKPQARSLTIGDIQSHQPQPVSYPSQPKMSTKQTKAVIKQTLQIFQKEAGALRPKK